MTPNPIICAIDTTDIAWARELARALQGDIGVIKLGLEFFTAHGAEGVKQVVPEGLPLFLDLKFHDIPNTVSKAIRALKGLPIGMLTIHTSGGVSMMQAAMEAADWLGTQNQLRPLVIGVTMLTSLNESDMEKIGVQLDVGKQVEKLAMLAQANGLNGVVCSPHEIERLRALFNTTPTVYGGGTGGEDTSSSQNVPPLTSPPQAGGINNGMLLVVPGIRPNGSANGDQKRTMTPKDALALGADYLVIGRPITEAADPVKAAQEIGKF